MNEIWELESATVKEVVERVNRSRGGEPLARNTLLKGIQRLEIKGWLRRKGEQRPAQYEATVPKDQAAAEMAGNLRDAVFGGCPVSLVRSLIGDTKLLESEIAELQSLIDDAAKKNRRKR